MKSNSFLLIFIRRKILFALVFLLLLNYSFGTENEIMKESEKFNDILKKDDKSKTDEEMRFLQQKFENSAEGNAVKPKLPDMPNKMPESVRFMEKSLMNAYGMAYKEAFGSHKAGEEWFGFGGGDKKDALNDNPNVGPPNDPSGKYPHDNRSYERAMSSENYAGEETIPILNANSNSVYTINFLWFHRSYPASNAIVGYNYWCSNGNHGDNDIITWEGEFTELKRVHGINIVWAYAPNRYAIEYAGDDGKYKLLIDWRAAIDNKKSYWWSSLIPALRGATKSFPLRITFPKAVFAKKIRILFKGPVNHYFGLYKVSFFTKDWKILIKGADTGVNDLCWTVNQINPPRFTKVKLMDCLKTIEYTENRELFTLNSSLNLVHFPSGLCVVSQESKDVFLQNCSWAKIRFDGREKFVFKNDGTIRSKYNNDECIYFNDPEGINYAKFQNVEVSSESADGNHQGSRAVDDNILSYWMSNPGRERVTFTVNFKNWVSGDNLVIDWKYIPVDFDIYIFSLEKGWNHFVKVTSNSNIKSVFTLNQYNYKAIQLRFRKSSKTLFGLMVYGIKTISVTDSSHVLARKKCSDIDDSKKNWQVDEQMYTVVEKKKNYVTEMTNLNKVYMKLRQVTALISHELDTIPQLKEKAGIIDKQLKDEEKKIKDLLHEIKKFRIELNKSNSQFGDMLNDFKLPFFQPYKPNPPDINKDNGGKKPPMKDGKVIGAANGSDTIGASKEKPAKDCYHIKHLYSYKKSGYYWLKPTCAEKTFRVFCDFSIKGKGVSIFFWNHGQIDHGQIHNVDLSEVKKIKYQCAKYGLYPIHLQNKNYVDRITQLAKLFGWNLAAKNSFIPLGFDHQCAKGAGLLCSQDYKSFNSEDTVSVKDFFPSKDSLFKSIISFAKASIFTYDTIGIGMNNEGKPHYDTLKNSHVAGIVCSTNETDFPKESDDIKLSCNESLKNSSQLDKTVGSKLEVVCPSTCFAKRKIYKVYGQTRYAEASSICIAAIHSGKMTKEGGKIKLNILGPTAGYMSSVAHEVKTKTWLTMTWTSFTIEKVHDKCPIDYFPNQSRKEKFGDAKSSFIEMESESTMTSEAATKNAMSELEQMALREMSKSQVESGKDASKLPGLSDMAKGGASLLDKLKGKNEMQNEMDKQLKKNEEKLEMDKEVQKMEENNAKLKQENAKLGTQHEVDKLKNLGAKLKAGLPSLPGMPGMPSLPGMPGWGGVKWPNLEYKSLLDQTMKKANEMKNSMDPNANPNVKAAEEAKKPKSNIPKPKDAKVNVSPTGEVTEVNTDSIIKKLLKYRKHDWDEIKFIKEYGDKLKELQKKFESQLAFSKYPSILSNVSLLKRYYALMNTVGKMNQLFKNVKGLAEWRLENTKKTIKALQNQMKSFNRYLAYRLKFEIKKFPPVDNEFEVFDNKQSKGGPSEWKYTNFSLRGKDNAIKQTSMISGKGDRYGSVIIVRDRQYYDFEYTCEIMVSEPTGKGGIVFRHQDNYNFYAFELDLKTKTKYLIKFVNGEKHILSKLQDGAIVLGNWFKVLIVMRKSVIKIKMGDTKVYKFKKLPLAFQVIDNTIASGSVGLFTDNLRDFHATNYQIVPLACEKPWKRIEREYINPKSSTYYEDFDKAWSSKYHGISPKDYDGGAPYWQFKENMFGKGSVVYQSNETVDKGINEEHAMSISKTAYMKNECIYKVHFMAVSDGRIGLVFKHKDPSNYYLFEIGGGADTAKRYFALRKRVNGKFHLISKHYSLLDLPNMTFVGYEPGLWYNAIITITKLKNIRIEVGILGASKAMTVFHNDDSDLNYGYIGFATYKTKAAFTEIDLRPIPIPYCEKEIHSVFNEDILKGDLCGKGEIKKKPFYPYKPKTDQKDNSFTNGDKKDSFPGTNKSNPNSRRPGIGKHPETSDGKEHPGKTWQPCLINKTKEQRNMYCDNTFKVSEAATHKCKSNFCEDCCIRNTPKDHSLYLYSCEKECEKNSAPTPLKKPTPEWIPVCIKPTNTHNIYKQCETQWPVDQVVEIGRCKRDQCRLCCATYDQAFDKISTIESNDQCFKKCQKTFGGYTLNSKHPVKLLN